MTLVVARSFASRLRMIGDSQISDLNAINRGLARGALKTVIVDQCLAIAFAGNLGRAQLALEAVRDEGGSGAGIEDVLSLLERFCIEGDGDTDFLLMNTDPDEEIVRVTAAGPERSLASAWIGDADAFEAYQELYHSAEDPVEEKESDTGAIGRMEMAFMELLRNGGIPGVGPPAVTITSKSKGLRYAPNAIVFPVRQTIPAGATVKVRFGTAAEGGYGHTVLVAEDVGVGAVGVHFYPGRIGVLYHPLHSAEPIIYRDVAPREFIQAVRDDTGVTIAGLIIE